MVMLGLLPLVAALNLHRTHAHAKARGHEDPLVYKAWSFVRGVSSELGAQAQGVLNVQTQLDGMEQNFTAEQANWTSRHDSLLASRMALEAEIARNEEAERQLTRLENENSLLRVKIAEDYAVANKIKQATDTAEAHRSATSMKYEAQIQALMFNLTAQQNRVKEVQTKQFVAIRANKQAVADLESQVYAQTELLRVKKMESSNKAAERAQSQSALIKQSITTQHQNAHAEAELLKLTATAVQVQKKQQEYAALLQGTKEISARVVAVNQKCARDKGVVEHQVHEAKAAQEGQKEVLQACQNEEAESQSLQTKLSSCHAGLSITIPH
jgi:hypothetical protein